MSEARFIFDEVVEDYPIMGKYLSSDASIVHNQLFEAAVVKILGGHESQMSQRERKAASSLSCEPTSESTTSENETLSYFERIEAKRRRLSSSVTKYLDCRFIPATSCSAERLFSAARWILTCKRKRMSPILFEALLFLKLNRNMWDIKSVASAMKLNPKERYTSLDSDEFYEE